MINFLIFVAIALLILSFAVTYYKLEYGFYLYIALIPLMHKEIFSLGYWDLLPIRIVAIGITIAVIYKFIKWRVKVDKKTCRNRVKEVLLHDYFFVLLAILWLVRGITLYKSENLPYSLGLFAFYSFVLSIYLIYRYSLVKLGEKWYLKILYVYLGIGLLASIFAYVQLILNYCCNTKIGGIWVNPNSLPRLGATFWDVNHFGGFLITLIPLSFALIFAYKKQLYKFLALLYTISSLFLLFMTQSRSAWFGLLIGMAFSLLVYYLLKLKRPLIFVIISSVSVLVLLSSFVFYKHINVVQEFKDYMHYRLDSTDTHVMLLEGATEVYVNNLPTGAGYGNFNNAFRETDTAHDYFAREPKLEEVRVPPHSIWGESMAETGSVGIITYVLFAILLVGSVIFAINFSKDKFYKYLGVGLVSSLFSVFVSGLFYSYNMEFYWFFIFLTIGYTFIVLKDKFSLVRVLKWWYDKPITPYLIIVPPAIFFIFLKLGTNTLVDWDEAIYAKVARNIVEHGDWLNLHWKSLNESWFEKPPLYMWSTAIMYKIFGFTAFATRITSAVFGFLGIILAYKFGEKLYNKLTGIFAALILLSTTQYLYYARNGMLDVTLTFFITLSLYFFYIAIEKYNTKANENKKDLSVSTYLLLSGTSVGLAVMTKAIVGLLPLSIMFFYSAYLVAFTSKKVPYIKLLYVLLTVLIVALPWHLYMSVVHGGEFLNDYLFEHILSRGLEGMGHEQPVWWFIKVIKTSMRIWVIPFIMGILLVPFFDKKNIRQYTLLIISTIIIFVFFSISKDKLQWYIMPIYPFAALISARFLDRLLVSTNIILKKEAQIDYKILRVVAIFVLLFSSILYIIISRNKIWVRDPNKDKVALILINNELYPKDQYPDKKLYYIRDASPALLFYSEHDIKKAKNKEYITDKIDNAQPDESVVFLLPDGMYYDLDETYTSKGTPIDLKVKGSAGGWVLAKSLSRIAILDKQLDEIVRQIKDIKRAISKGEASQEEINRLNELYNQVDQIAEKKKEYGYPMSEKEINDLKGIQYRTSQ